MSNKNSQFFLVKEDQEEEKEEIKLDNLSQPQLEIIDSCQQEDEGIQEKKPEDETDHKKEEEEGGGGGGKKEEICEITSVSFIESKIPCLGESEVAENDDGFRTPTSLDQKIPVMTQCPPAPKKTRPEPSMKRKASRRSLQFDVSAEVDSIFSPIPEEDLDLKFKKPRTDRDED
ncbi:Uncharacterized protein Adt_34508 [Abeliophyllum distichum]|uniref:Uncharacterized protein n=1 Tax=Abeliophyllum distichum TaxID=126358 RepID=A0ABD1QZC1_9LAMI